MTLCTDAVFHEQYQQLVILKKTAHGGGRNATSDMPRAMPFAGQLVGTGSGGGSAAAGCCKLAA